MLTLIILFALFFYYFSKNQNKLIIEKKTLESRFQQELLQTQIEIQEQTLKTISQEIHDNVGQILSLAKLNLNTIEPAENNKAKLTDTKNLVSKAINDLRDLSRSMHGDRIAELGLQQSIADELLILQNSGEFETDLKIAGEIYKLPPQKEMVLFRIVQEALHNSIKHAKAGKMEVQMNYHPEIFVLTISDNGNGFSPEAMQLPKKGIGMKSMQSRAELIGGKFSIQSTEKNGTSIFIEIPILKS